MSTNIDITNRLTPKRKEDGGIDHRYSRCAEKIVELTGSVHIGRLREFYDKTNQLDDDYSKLEWEYKADALAICSAYWVAQEEFDKYQRNTLKKRVLTILKDLGFRGQKASYILGSAELRYRIPRANLFNDGWDVVDTEKGMEWVRKLPMTSQYTLNRTSRHGIVSAYIFYADNGKNLVPKETLEAIQQKNPRDDGETRGRKPKDEKANRRIGDARKDFLLNCIVNNDSLPLIDSVGLANKWSIVSSNHEELLRIVEQKLIVIERDTSFEERLREMLDKHSYDEVIQDQRWEQLALPL